MQMHDWLADLDEHLACSNYSFLLCTAQNFENTFFTPLISTVY